MSDELIYGVEFGNPRVDHRPPVRLHVLFGRHEGADIKVCAALGANDETGALRAMIAVGQMPPGKSEERDRKTIYENAVELDDGASFDYLCRSWARTIFYAAWLADQAAQGRDIGNGPKPPTSVIAEADRDAKTFVSIFGGDDAKPKPASGETIH